MINMFSVPDIMHIIITQFRYLVYLQFFALFLMYLGICILNMFHFLFKIFIYLLLFKILSYSGDSLAIIPWHERKHREEDWCEELECR